MARIATVDFAQEIDGDTFGTKEFNFFNSDGITPLDLDDATVKVQIRKGSPQGKLVKTAISGDGITWVNQTQGEFQLGGFIITWGAGDYYYDVQMTYTTSGIVRTYVKGKIEVINDVTAA